MNLANALGFLVLSLVMRALPSLAPSLVSMPVGVVDSARGLWLECMSYVIGGIGFSYVVVVSVRELPGVLASWNARIEQAARPLVALARKPAREESASELPSMAVRAAF